MDQVSLQLKGGVKGASYESKRIEWEIPDIFKDESFFYESPSFATRNHVWKFNLTTEYSKKRDRLFISMYNNVKLKYVIEYFFSFKESVLSNEIVVSGRMGVGTTGFSWRTLTTKSELLWRKTELVPSNILTIFCVLRWMSEAQESVEPPNLNQVDQTVKLTGLDKLSENFKHLFADKESSDVTLKVKDREFKVHESILMARCSVFAAIFKSDTKGIQTKLITITDCDAKTFQDFLKYLYCGKIEKLSLQNAMNLYYTAHKYDITELKEFCTETIKQNLKLNSLFEVAALAKKYDDSHLFRVVQDCFNGNTTEIFEMPEWQSLMQNDFCLGNMLLRGMSGNVSHKNDSPQQPQKKRRC